MKSAFLALPLSLMLGACAWLPIGKHPKPAPDAATASATPKVPNPAAGADYPQQPSADSRKALATLHQELDSLQKDPALQNRAPAALAAAVKAVAEADRLQSAADRPANFIEVVTGDAQKVQVDVRPLAQLIYIAERRVQVARALSEGSWYQDQGRAIVEQLRAQAPPAATQR